MDVRERRSRATVNYAAFDASSSEEEGGFGETPAAPGVSRVEALVARHRASFSAAAPGVHIDALPLGSELTLPWLRRHGLHRPILVNDARGLGLRVPRAGFAVRDVAAVVGADWPIEVLDVSAQSEAPGAWTLQKWADYYHAPPAARRKVLNVITLEFSGTPLARRVRAPRFVRQIDWIDNVFPGARRAQGEYPQVQLYCLMSVGGCWTDWHLDFGGTSVWYHVHTGAKTFFLVPPTAPALAAFEAWTRSAAQGRTFFPDTLPPAERAAACWLTLAAGQTLVIPAGYLHAVFTPEDSLVFGGNYLHGMAMATQLRVYELELASRVKKKYRFPFFEHINWFAVAYYAQFTRLPEFGALLRAALRPGAGGEEEEEERLALALDALGLSIHELRGLPALLQTMAHLRSNLLSRDAAAAAGAREDSGGGSGGGGGSSGGGGGGSGGGGGGGGGEPQPAGQATGVGAAPPAPRLRLSLKARAGAAPAAAAAAATAAAAAAPVPAAQRIKGAVVVSSGLASLSTVGEDEYAVFPPSHAAAEAAALAGAASPEELLAEVAAALRAGAGALGAPPAGGGSGAGAVAPAPPAPSLLAMHGGDGALPRELPAPLYALHAFQKGRPVLHLGPAAGWAAPGALPPSTLAPGAALPRCKLGLYGGAAPVFDAAAEAAEAEAADAAEEMEAAVAAAAAALAGEFAEPSGGGDGGEGDLDAPLPAPPKRRRRAAEEEEEEEDGEAEAEFSGSEGEGEDEDEEEEGEGGRGKRGARGAAPAPRRPAAGQSAAAPPPARDPRATAMSLFHEMLPNEQPTSRAGAFGGGGGGGGGSSAAAAAQRGGKKAPPVALSGAAGLRALLKKNKKR